MRTMPTLLIWTLTFAVGCADDGGRDTPGGGFKATCMVTADCGCISRTVDDPLCTEAGQMQLQCLGGGTQSKCTLACSSDTLCTNAFGLQASCSSFGYCQ